MPHLFRVDRVRGCLLGLAVGDALGAPLEGLSQQQIKTHYGRVTNYVDGVVAWKRKPHRWRMPGLYTDDTQQALALCEVLLECRHIDQDRLADLYMGLMTPKGPFSGAHRGIGRSFRYVLSSLEQGVPPHLAGQPTAGIGAAMRIAPVALYFGEETGPMFDSVMAASLMTHRDIRSLGGALAVAHGVRRSASGAARDASLLFRVAADLINDEVRIGAEFRDHVLKSERHAGGLARAIAHAERSWICQRNRPSLRSSRKPTATGPTLSVAARPWGFHRPASPPASIS